MFEFGFLQELLALKLRRTLSMMKQIFGLIILSIIPKSVNAGLDKYSFLDKIDNWTIERKVNSTDKNVSCRASIFSNGTWFGSRIRLNKNDELYVPSDLFGQDQSSYSSIPKVKRALMLCRKSLIYIPEGANQ